MGNYNCYESPDNRQFLVFVGHPLLHGKALNSASTAGFGELSFDGTVASFPWYDGGYSKHVSSTSECAPSLGIG
jgi:hypothetical protein